MHPLLQKTTSKTIPHPKPILQTACKDNTLFEHLPFWKLMYVTLCWHYHHVLGFRETQGMTPFQAPRPGKRLPVFRPSHQRWAGKMTRLSTGDSATIGSLGLPFAPCWFQPTEVVHEYHIAYINPIPIYTYINPILGCPISILYQ